MSFIVKGHFVYLAHPRTASVATEDLLKRSFPCGEVTKNHHATIDEIDCKGNEYVITTIRDPLDLMVTWWSVNPGWHKFGFEKFLTNYTHISMGRKLFYHLRDTRGKYIRYDGLYTGYYAMIVRYGGLTTRFEKKNVTPKKKEVVWTQKLLRIMWDRFPSDMVFYHTKKDLKYAK